MTNHHDLKSIIETAYESRTQLTPRNASAEVRAAIDAALGELDAGTLRVASPHDGAWQVNEWLKKAVLLSFRIKDNAVIPADAMSFYDKVPLKYSGWSAEQFAAAGVRVVIVPDLKHPPADVAARAHGVIDSLADAIDHVPHWFPRL